jgi:hypothetical protein
MSAVLQVLPALVSTTHLLRLGGLDAESFACRTYATRSNWHTRTFAVASRVTGFPAPRHRLYRHLPTVVLSRPGMWEAYQAFCLQQFLKLQRALSGRASVV